MIPTPHNHFIAGPDCRMKLPTGGRVSDAGCYPTIRAGIVSATTVQKDEILVLPAPDNHLTAGPKPSMTGSGRRCVSDVSGCPAISTRSVAPASVKRVAVMKSSPD